MRRTRCCNCAYLILKGFGQKAPLKFIFHPNRRVAEGIDYYISNRYCAENFSLQHVFGRALDSYKYFNNPSVQRAKNTQTGSSIPDCTEHICYRYNSIIVIIDNSCAHCSILNKIGTDFCCTLHNIIG